MESLYKIVISDKKVKDKAALKRLSRRVKFAFFDFRKLNGIEYF